MRAFIAIDLPEPVRGAIAGLQLGLSVGQPVKADNLHLTLAFLGEQPDALIQDVHDHLQSVRSPVFGLRLSGLDTFGGADPKILFLGADAGDPLVDLRKKIRSALRSAGVQLPRERFRPHVTLARFRRGMTLHDLERLKRFLSTRGGFGLDPFPVTSFALYRSTLRPEGALHEELARYSLT